MILIFLLEIHYEQIIKLICNSKKDESQRL